MALVLSAAVAHLQGWPCSVFRWFSGHLDCNKWLFESLLPFCQESVCSFSNHKAFSSRQPRPFCQLFSVNPGHVGRVNLKCSARLAPTTRSHSKSLKSPFFHGLMLSLNFSCVDHVYMPKCRVVVMWLADKWLVMVYTIRRAQAIICREMSCLVEVFTLQVLFLVHSMVALWWC